MTSESDGTLLRLLVTKLARSENVSLSAIDLDGRLVNHGVYSKSLAELPVCCSVLKSRLQTPKIVFQVRVLTRLVKGYTAGFLTPTAM